MTPLKIGIVSDLHTEFWNATHFRAGGIYSKVHETLTGADLILLAGDIGNGVEAIETAKMIGMDVPVCFTPGNHEFYQNDYRETLAAMRQAAAGSNVVVLDKDAYRVTIGDRSIRVLGTTLWTDFALHGTSHLSMIAGKRRLNDFRMIRYEGRTLLPQDTVDWHNEDRDWLFDALATEFDGTTIVMTHHAPVSFAISENYVNDALSPCFASRLEDRLIRDDVALVVWGHTHHPVDRTIERTRFVSSQTGYERNYCDTETGCYGIIVEL
jgi:predicted phosphodiesterase